MLLQSAYSQNRQVYRACHFSRILWKIYRYAAIFFRECEKALLGSKLKPGSFQLFHILFRGKVKVCAYGFCDLFHSVSCIREHYALLHLSAIK